jgi:hypothetical protein
MQHGSRTSPAITLPAHQVGCRIRHRSCTFVTGRWCGYRCHASTHCTARPSRKPISRRHGVAHRVLRFVVGRRGSARRHRVTRENGRVFCHHVIGTTSKFDGPLLAALTEATREEEQEETRVARGFRRARSFTLRSSPYPAGAPPGGRSSETPGRGPPGPAGTGGARLAR